jgi:hypothetical protein
LHGRPLGKRTERGSGIVEGVIGLFLVIAGATGGTLLLTNVGTTLFYKEKLTFVTSQAAAFAATQGQASPESVQPVVDALLNKVGLPNSQSVTVDTDNATRTVTVSVSLSNLALVGSGTLLPAVLTNMHDTEAAVKTGPDGYVEVLTAHDFFGSGGVNGLNTPQAALGYQVPAPAPGMAPTIPIYYKAANGPAPMPGIPGFSPSQVVLSSASGYQ